MNAGFGWSHAQRPDPNGTHLSFWGYRNEQTKNVFIRNNIFYESSNYGSRYDNLSTLSKVIVDYNCWYESSGPIATIAGKQYDFASQVEAYKSISGMDAHSVFANPLFGSDFALTNTSPCIDAGISTLAVTEDFNGTLRPQGKKSDIGAFESDFPNHIEIEKSGNGISIFPNPVCSKLTIEKEQLDDPVTIIISDINGQEHLRLQMKGNRREVDISNFAKGIYFVMFKTDKSIEVNKFMKR
jgi:hypothetical protein